MTNENYFKELSSLDVGNYIEKKGQFSYLSWAWAVEQIKLYDPQASWETRWFTNPNTGETLPYALGPNGAFVEVTVTVKGITHKQIQPVMDFKNKSIANPDAMDVNKAIQRCLVKCIALHGLGLYIYAGEDLPNDLISGPQIKSIEKKAAEFAELRGGTIEKVYDSLGVPSLMHLTSGQANLVEDKLQGWINKAKKANEEAQKVSEVATEAKEEKGA